MRTTRLLVLPFLAATVGACHTGGIWFQREPDLLLGPTVVDCPYYNRGGVDAPAWTPGMGFALVPPAYFWSAPEPRSGAAGRPAPMPPPAQPARTSQRITAPGEPPPLPGYAAEPRDDAAQADAQGR
jgi:hypothetical protein